MDRIGENFAWMRRRVDGMSSIDKIGKVIQVTGLVIESEGPEVSLGEVCEILSSRRNVAVTAEVVGFRDNRVLLMPLGDMHEIHPGCQVIASDRVNNIPVGEGLIGRVIDGLGYPLDGRGPLRVQYSDTGLNRPAPNPMLRRPITESFSTGVRSLDSFTPLGTGQRVGIFAGSGVGKSTLLGMIARGSDSDINVLSLVGERGRELREFVEKELGEEGMKRSIVVVSTSDQPAPMRIRAAMLATSIAEHFRDSGKKVLLMMDSLTRFCMAQREIGLAVGEPPTSRGYTPSVFSVLPRLLERAGMSEQGSITGIYTVLVEGDDLNEPIADAARGILDGHIVLSRNLATSNHFPAVDVLESVSRLIRSICTNEEVDLVSQARDMLAIYRKNEDLINIGAYAKGSNARIDFAIEHFEALSAFLRQNSHQLQKRDETFNQLKRVMS
ncbi:MAG: FliI/YscN family ATPase [Opitutales bacterium]|nr:FliI/YscN family ATPase [Opitutales bacterium]